MHQFPKPLLAVLLFAPLARGVTLKPETRAGWEVYVALVDGSIKNAAPSDFLSFGTDPSQVADVQQGNVTVAQLRPESASSVPHGLIHDWLGTIFIPGATLADVFAVTRTYDRYPQWYGPTIVQGQLLQRSDRQDCFSLRYVRHVLFVTAVLDAEYEAEYVQVSPTSWYSLARSTRLQEIDQNVKATQRKAAPDDGSGYLWRAYTVTRYEERDNGVYIEQESIGLSRPIPASLRWVVEPVVKRLARDLLADSLKKTREAVLSARKQQKIRAAGSSPASPPTQ